MSDIRKFQCGFEAITALCIGGDSDLAGIMQIQHRQVEANPAEISLLSLESAATGNSKKSIPSVTPTNQQVDTSGIQKESTNK